MEFEIQKKMKKIIKDKLVLTKCRGLTMMYIHVVNELHPNEITGTHNYTTNKAENDMLVNLGWKGEGIGWYGVK